ncbi:hypothetical protein [Rhodohalobacter barkolensis]|uniref:Uncharacterized protein n=1 Tax=Rhodohalobacter barkolensis TaxID=2053187 RepID=A0A2N0VK49_9BACT|nr:hypothetical protein [Rhodohalobacter barkolensis]PKD44534.1 hypothetical protein CWD77_03450 [Rhodohalobacter barkolensis]
MTDRLEIEEKYSRFWPIIAVISGLAAVVLFAFYLIVDEVLIEGYLRLISFSFFALMVLSLFKVKDGKVEIVFETENNTIYLTYYVRDRLVYEEDFSLDKIKDLKVDYMPNKSLYNDFAKKDRCVRFKKGKSDDWLYMAQLFGRVIPLTQSNAEKIADFVRSKIEEKDEIELPKS